MNYSTMTIRDLNDKIRYTKKLIKHSQSSTKSTMHNYRNVTCSIALEEKKQQIEWEKEELTYQQNNLISLQTELKNRA